MVVTHNNKSVTCLQPVKKKIGFPMLHKGSLSVSLQINLSNLLKMSGNTSSDFYQQTFTSRLKMFSFQNMMIYI
ncbi:MAG: hypothetical protein CSA21_04535 [Deltaproteobacteria bacterium]|nr:MAG: hypothetical protein CSA21_04535 [Deltaproteobacteria bacterium]